MITDALVSFIHACVVGLLGLLPTFTEPAMAFGALGTAIGEAASLFGQWFPVGTLALCLAALFSIRLILSAWNLLMWVWEKIPFN